MTEDENILIQGVVVVFFVVVNKQCWAKCVWYYVHKQLGMNPDPSPPFPIHFDNTLTAVGKNVHQATIW